MSAIDNTLTLPPVSLWQLHEPAYLNDAGLCLAVCCQP